MKRRRKQKTLAKVTDCPQSPRYGHRIVLLLLILCGFAVRFAYLQQFSRLPFFEHPIGDSGLYLERAREIEAGKLVPAYPFFLGGALYPYVLALFSTVSTKVTYTVALLQHLLGIALALVLYRIARLAAATYERGRSAALLAAGLTLFYGPFAFFEADTIMLSWTLLTSMLSALLLLRNASGAHCSKWRLMLAGFFLGISASERPNLLLLVPIGAFWEWRFNRAPGRSRRVVSLLAGALLGLSPVVGLNYAASGQFVLLTTSAGINFYIGNHDGARGTYEEPWLQSDPGFVALHPELREASLIKAAQETGRPVADVDTSRYWFGRGLAFIREHPRQAALLYLRKFALLWNNQEIPNHLSFAFLRSLCPALDLMPIRFAIVASLGLFCITYAPARQALHPCALLLLAVFVLGPMLSILPFFVADRYRAPTVPPMIVLAAFGLVEIASLVRARLVGRVVLAVIGITALTLLLSVRLTRFGDRRSLWMLAEGYRVRGDLAGAAASFRRALAESPGDPLLLNNLGNIYLDLGDTRQAEDAYRQAATAAPKLGPPAKNLGLLIMRQRRFDEAFPWLQQAERADPSDIDVARAIAALHFMRGDLDGARDRAQRVLAVEPGDERARALLTMIDQRTGSETSR